MAMKGYTVFHKLLQYLSSSITEASPLDFFTQDTRWEGLSYSSAEMQSVYSTAPADYNVGQHEKPLL